MSSPVVVQGTPVGNPYVATATPVQPSNPTTTTRGEQQASSCNDPLFAGLLYANVAAILIVAALYGPDAVNDETSTQDFRGYVWTSLVCAVLSFVAAAGAVAVLMCIPETLIKVSLLFVVALSGVWAAMAFLSGAFGAGILGVIFFAISVCYARAVWGRIPFASVNLVTACTAIKGNLGVLIVAYLFTGLGVLWSVTWSVAFVGVFDTTYECDENNVCSDPSYGILFVLFLAYFFTHQVLQVGLCLSVLSMSW